MIPYKMTTNKTWLQTRSEIALEMKRWEIADWLVEKYNNGAKLSYVRNGKTIDLYMDKQARPQDNLRVLFYTVQALRMNEVRGISEVMASAYLQIAAPVIDRDPYEVLGLPRGTALAVCEAQFKELAKQFHPDRPGGSAEKMTALTKAIEEIRERAK
jgi:hypothetical protein